MTAREKYSGGPKRSAAEASVGAKSIRATIPNVPAIKDPKAAIPSAGPALPCFAIWYPSKLVATDDASPGIFSKMEVVDPPY